MTTVGWVLLFAGTLIHWVAVMQDKKRTRHLMDTAGGLICVFAWIFIGMPAMCGLSFLLLSGHLNQVVNVDPVMDRLEKLITRPKLTQLDTLAEEVEG